ncbi:MAG: hypothetical protein CALGDGBN_01786 [Pseudomonadales bacterium]|nr:hypothetical protein [Pseudomonadales bacterium]
MNSLPVPDVPEGEVVLVAEGGVPCARVNRDDPIAQWVALMEVVEMLCPQWPVREQLAKGESFRL